MLGLIFRHIWIKLKEITIIITMSKGKDNSQKSKNEYDQNSKNNFETFDLWGKSNFILWSNARYDFELIAELTRYKSSTRNCLELLDMVNKYTRNTPKGVFFDGTIKSLKYLVKNNFLDIATFPNITNDEKYLVELLNKYSKRLDITEIFSDIEEPTLRAMLLEYPHLLKNILEDPLGGSFITKAMLKNNITDINSFTQKVDDGSSSIEVDVDKNSKEAMKCKIICIGLRLNNGNLQVSSNALETINQFESLTDESIENETYTKGTFNAMYAVFYGSNKWNKEKKVHLTGCESLYLDFQLLFLPENHMSMIYDIFLEKEVDKIGKKYFKNEYRPEGFIASLAIKMAIVIILFRTENFIPKKEKAEVSIFTPGAMLGALNYAVKETSNKQNPLCLKQWFLEYFRDELDKRVAFIKMQVENNVAVANMGLTRVIYLPVFESFRFFCERDSSLNQTIRLLKNRNIPNSVKDDIFINFAINIQKIIAQQESTNEEERLKDTFILLISEAFKGLMVNLGRKLKEQSKRYYQHEDLLSDAMLSTIELILKFDLKRNNSFIAYLTHNLRLKMITSGRMKKTDQNTYTEGALEEDFLNSIPDEKEFISLLHDKNDIKKIHKYIEGLPRMEKEAVKKIMKDNEKFTETDRRAKNRGLIKIRKMMDNP